MKSNHKLALLCTLLVIMLGLFFKLVFTLSSEMASNSSLPGRENTASVITSSESAAAAPEPDTESPPSDKPVESRIQKGQSEPPAIQEAAPSASPISPATSPDSKTSSPSPENTVLPEGFVYISDVIPGAKFEIRYSTNHNFTGQIVTGYYSYHASLTAKAAEALKNASKALKKEGFGIKVYDAYRPKQAVDFFVQL